MNIFYWNWEFDWLYALQQIRNPALDWLMVALSTLGDAGILWIGLSVIFLITAKYRKTGAWMMISIALAYIIGNLVLKNIVMRARPFQIDPSIELLVKAPTDYSFPSGHSINGFAASVSLFCRSKKLGIPAIVVAACIAFSRLYNFVHFPTDVLFGAFLGAAVALLMHALSVKLEKKRLPGNV